MQFTILSILSIEANQVSSETIAALAAMATPTYVDSNDKLNENIYSLADIECMSRELITDAVNKDLEAIEQLVTTNDCAYFRIEVI